jgi:uncharacterized membrane protein YhfC
MDVSTLTHFLNPALMIALPILLGIYLVYKSRLSGKYWLIGAATFIISQVFHIPFNSYVLNPIFEKIQLFLPAALSTLVIAAMLGLSAGIFEECARYGMYRWWLKTPLSWWRGILTGAGHGGIESIILGVLVLLSFFNMMAYRNMDLSSLNLTQDKIDIARQQIQMYWSLPWYDSLLGAVERIFTIPFHIAASILVLQVFTRKPGHQQLGWLFLAIIYHAIMDASAVIVVGKWGGYVAEAILGVMAILDIIIIFALRQPEPEPVELTTTQNINEPPAFTPNQIEETSDNLENTRYQ